MRPYSQEWIEDRKRLDDRKRELANIGLWESEFLTGVSEHDLLDRVEEILAGGGLGSYSAEYASNMGGHEEFMGWRFRYITGERLREYVDSHRSS